MTNTPLNPDGIEAAASILCDETAGQHTRYAELKTGIAKKLWGQRAEHVVSAYLSVAQPEVDETALANLIAWKKLPFMATQFIQLDANAAHKVIELLRPHLSVAQPEVTSVEELDALPDGSIVKDAEGEVYIMTPYDEFWRVWGNDKRFSSGEIVLPARVLNLPEESE